MTDYHEVGCRKCTKERGWDILTTEVKDGTRKIKARCRGCDHETQLFPAVIRNSPDPEAYDMRYFT